MDKEEPNLSTWGDISDSELVPEAAKIQKKNTKNNKKKNTSLRAVCEKLRRKQKINVIVKNKSTTDNFPWSTLL